MKNGSKNTLSEWHWHPLNLGNSGSQSGVAKLTASAILKPRLKPEWYPEFNVITNSPGF